MDIELPPEPGTVPDPDLGIRGPDEPMTDDDNKPDPADSPVYDHDDADEADDLDGEVGPLGAEDGLEEPEDDSEDD